jgi:HAD superfamily hydrolase (TIGR01450 family)
VLSSFGTLRIMPHQPVPDDDLRAALHGIRALILDADGVLVLRGAAIPGTADALAVLAARGIPYRIVTNFSMAHRDTLAARFSGGGAAVDPAHVVTAASAAAAWAAARHPGQPLFVLAAPDALREFAGQDLRSPREASAPGASVAAVVIGDAGEDLSFANLDTAFRLVRGGADFMAMHRNPWWLTPRGATLDAGAVIAGLEFALGRKALIAGKPSPVVFRQAAAAIAADLGVRRLPAASIAMVGDDLRSDLAPARRLGMRTALVLTGKVEPGTEEAAIARARFRPDVIAPSLAELAAAL